MLTLEMFEPRHGPIRGPSEWLLAPIYRNLPTDTWDRWDYRGDEYGFINIHKPPIYQVKCTSRWCPHMDVS